MEKILKRVYSSRKILLLLSVISHLVVAFSVICYAFILYHHLFISDDKMAALGIAVSSAVPFLLVSVIRAFINAPRPYELYDFYEKRPKDKAARSFPSRHAFSIFLIATLAVTVSTALAVLTFILGVALSVCRVLLGIHFIRDVAAGALIGVISGLLGIFTLL